jgi:putative membrane protein
MNSEPRKPRAVLLDEADPANDSKSGKARNTRSAGKFTIEPIPDEAVNEQASEAPPAMPVKRKSVTVLTVFLFALAGLVSLASGIALDQLVRELFSRNEWLGWTGMFFTALLTFAILIIAIREIRGLLRLRTLANIRQDSREANDNDDSVKARHVIRQLAALYAQRPDTARGRASLDAHEGEIIDGSDLIKLAERDLLAHLDNNARIMVMNSAKRVSIVTAVSPRAMIDIAYVLIENLRLIRRLSEHYGGNPGTIGFWRLTRNVLAHLAATGIISLGDGIVQQLVGHGLAARVSARLGEGVINGVLTARIGLAAIDLCRPIPFIHQPRPKITGFITELARLNGILPTSGTKVSSASTSGNETISSGRND